MAPGGASFLTSGVNFVTDGAGFVLDSGPGLKTIGNARLGGLSDNGGSTHTMLPLAGSPAIDPSGGDPTASGNDQQGFPRLQGTTADVGAVEVTFEAPDLPRLVVEQPTGTPLVSGESTIALGSVQTGSTSGLTFTIRNLGQADLTGLSGSITGSHAADFEINPLSENRLTSGESTTLTVVFTPQASGSRTALLRIESGDEANSPFIVALAGESTEPITTPTPRPPVLVLEQPVDSVLANGESVIAFGMPQIGSTSGLTFTIRNTGEEALAGVLVTIEGGNPSDFAIGGQLESPLLTGESGTFTIAFSPQEAGARSASLRIESNDEENSPFFVTLTGEGATPVAPPLPAAPQLLVEQSADSALVAGIFVAELGTVQIGSTSGITFTIRNRGGESLAGLAAAVEGANASEFAVMNLTETELSPGASTTFSVVFSPEAAGDRNASLRIESNDATNSPFVVSLTGTATASSLPPSIDPAKMVVEESANQRLVDGQFTVSLGSVQTSASSGITFTIRNVGDRDLIGISASIAGSNQVDFAVGTLEQTALGPGASNTCTVVFSPSTPASKTATLRLENGDDPTNPFQIKLVGTGVAPPDSSGGLMAQETALQVEKESRRSLSSKGREGTRTCVMGNPAAILEK